ncbi:MCE family protein [Mycolicibacterium sp. XJ1819]
MLTILTAAAACGCGSFRGLNSISLPGTKGGGPEAIIVQAQLPDAQNLERNSRVRVGDVTVGHVTDIQLQGWHALVTMSLLDDVDLPANATATIGQTSLLGSVHVELAPPPSIAPQGRLTDGSLVPLASAGAFPSTEQTLAAVSMVLNGGGLGQLEPIVEALSTAFTGRDADLRSLIEQFDIFVGHLNEQKDDIIAAMDSLNNMVGKFADEKPVLDKALNAIPRALEVLADERENLTETFGKLGQIGSLAADSVDQIKENLVNELRDVGPVLQSLADAGPALTRSLDMLVTVPFPKSTLDKWIRGDYANLTAVVDLTLSRLDAGLFTGTRWECDLTELELKWGRTIGQMPSPCTAGGPGVRGNPLVAPYRFDQGP